MNEVMASKRHPRGELASKHAVCRAAFLARFRARRDRRSDIGVLRWAPGSRQRHAREHGGGAKAAAAHAGEPARRGPRPRAAKIAYTARSREQPTPIAA